jgi:transposase
MCAVLEELGLAGLVTTIAGLTVTGAAAILAETGDPARFATPRALVKHAGLCPRDNSSGAAQGKTSISGRGRPGLRLAAWRAVWAAMPNNPVMAARFGYLTTRQDNRLARQQARTACAAAQRSALDMDVGAGPRPAPARAAGPGRDCGHELTSIITGVFTGW